MSNRAPAFPSAGDAFFRSFVHTMPPSYRRIFDEEAITAHAAIAERRGASSSHVEIWRELPERVVAICIVADDGAGLLARISAACVAHQIDVMAAQAYCRKRPDAHAEAVDFFWVRRISPSSRAALPIRPRDIAAFGETLDALIRGRASFDRAVHFARAVRAAGESTRVRFDSDHHDGTMVLTVEGTDRPGLLLLISEALLRERVQIARSDVTTRDRRILDRFYLTELDGGMLKRSRLLGIQTAVLAAIEQSRRST